MMSLLWQLSGWSLNVTEVTSHHEEIILALPTSPQRRLRKTILSAVSYRFVLRDLFVIGWGAFCLSRALKSRTSCLSARNNSAERSTCEISELSVFTSESVLQFLKTRQRKMSPDEMKAG